MNTFGKFVCGALAGAATLTAVAGIYCAFFDDDDEANDRIASLEEDGDDAAIPVNEEACQATA